MELQTIDQIAEMYHTPFGVYECREINISEKSGYKKAGTLIKAFRVNGVRMDIKKIKGYIYAYGLERKSKYGLNNKVLEQSDNPNHLLHKMYNKYVIKW